MFVVDDYSVYYKDQCIASYYVFNTGDAEYYVSDYALKALKDEPLPKALRRGWKGKAPMPFFAELLREENRVPGRKRPVYQSGPLTVNRIAQETGEKFMVYRRSAKKGEEGYSEKEHSAPHWEGPNTPEGMKEWASWYCFNKMDDGTYQAELDEAWWWGGGHNDGGTIRREIPEEWFALPYEEFLENVVTLSAAAHYGFTAEDLKEKKGLREFFGF